VLPRAGRQTVSQLRAALSRAVLSVDPQAAEARHERALEGRQVTVRPLRDGMAELWALLPADSAAAVYSRIDRLARCVPAGDPRGRDARRADALVAAVLRRPTATVQPAETSTHHSTAASGPTPVAAPDVIATVHVTVPAATALGLGEEPGELAGHGPVPVSRRLADTGAWRKVTTDPVSGVVVDVGRRACTPSAALADLVAPVTAPAASRAAANPRVAATWTTSSGGPRAPPTPPTSPPCAGTTTGSSTRRGGQSGPDRAAT
jgi:hypothetical protein